MKRLLIITAVLFFSTLVLPQDKEKKNPNVELPDFVITGKDVISLQKAKKLDPGTISTISEEFIKPVYSSEELGISDLPNPIKDQLNLADTQNVYNSRLTIGTGIYTSPAGRFSMTQPFGGGMIGAVIKGENHRAFIDNSDWYKFKGALNFAFFVPNDASLRGTQFKFHGDYGINSYRFFASNNPSTKRNYYKGNYSVDVNNLVGKYFNFDIKANDKYSYLGNENFSENLLRVESFLRGNFTIFKLAGNINYTRQFITNNAVTSGSFDYIFVRPYIQFSINNFFTVAGGISYSKNNSTNYTAPYASAALKLNDFISLYGEYNPTAEFLSAGELLEANKYFSLIQYYNSPRASPFQPPLYFSNSFVKKTSAFNAVLKFQYFKYYEIDAGIKYFNADNLSFFVSSAQSGMFDVNFTGAKNYSMFVNLLFHQGPFGVFYGTAEYNDTKDNSSNQIPYSPKFKATLSYGYNFKFGFYFEPRLYYYSESYADVSNLKKIDSYIDLGAKFAYKFGRNFSLNVELSNLVDRKNYKWYGYREAPLDLIAGFTYKW